LSSLERSREGRADPIRAFWYDLKRATHAIRREVLTLWRYLTGNVAARKRPPQTIDVETPDIR